jgi:cytochrome c biogenesis protein CcmG/thiol:disulfide interchange protein DsbE
MRYNVGMRIKPVLFFLIVGAAAAFLIYRQVSHHESIGEVTIGSQAPDFTIKDAAGTPVKLSALRGNVVVLNFWATWCAPCVKEAPELARLNNEFKDRKFRMMAVSVDNDWQVVRDFYKEHNLDMPTFLDPGHAVAGAYRVTAFPETFIIDGNGSVLKHIVGPPASGWDGPQMIASIDTLVKQQEVPQRAAQ